MNSFIRTFFLSFSILLLLSACSIMPPLQSGRLDTAESHIIQAEHALQRKQIRIADENLGTASAYLLTLRDNKKALTKNELKRYQALKQRSEGLMKQIR